MVGIVSYVLGFVTGGVATVAFLFLMRIFTAEDIEKRIAEMREAIEQFESPKEE